MEKERVFYNELVEKIISNFKGTYEGKMMSSPGVKFNNKVFVFYFKKDMVFRLGDEFSPLAFAIKNPRLLDPFKNKPPLKGWFVIGYDQKDRWEELSDLAFEFVKTLK
ncbi:MAG: hypothetical protein PF485_02355 [Bacteroidales bacterium]|jgi:hypothetical protein|nr:hypothetical protein [Bacteroidales bacterium]